MNALPASSFQTPSPAANPFWMPPSTNLLPAGPQRGAALHDGPGNHLLQRLPAHERERLLADLEPVQLHAAQVLCEAGARQQHVYFPDGATLSLMSLTRAGDTCELMAIGRDGLAGPDVALGSEHSLHRLMVQRGGKAWRLRAGVLRQALAESPALRQQLSAQLQLQLLHLAQGVVCHTHHSITERLCCWLLDNAPRQNPGHVELTHEAVSSLLGVRRESVTQAAGRLQALGLLSTRRGQLTVHDREGLRAHACECHDRLAQARQRLLARGDESATPGWLGEGSLSITSIFTNGGSAARLPTLAYGQMDTEPVSRQDVDAHHEDDRDAEESLYRELYEFAPVGFVTLDSQRRILQTNIAAAVLLGIPASRLQRLVFSELLQSACRDDFARFHREVLGGRCRRHCDVALIDHGRGASTVLRLQASTDEDGQECRMVLMDLGEGLPAHNGELRVASALTAAPISVTGDPQVSDPAQQCTAQGISGTGLTAGATASQSLHLSSRSLATTDDRTTPDGATLTFRSGQGTASWISGLLP